MTPALPPIVDRATWQAQLDDLKVREKAHTREGDALAAARRRLPMVETDASAILIGEHGETPLLDVFEGRTQLLAYFHMWHAGHDAAGQCEGCTFSTAQVTELGYLHMRDVTYATFCEGPYPESSRYAAFLGYTTPWYSLPEQSYDALIAGRHFGILVSYLRDGDRVFETSWMTGRGNEIMAPTWGLLDRTVYGRQEHWEDSPEGWPKQFGTHGDQMRRDGRPTAQWSALAAGRSDDLGPTTGGGHHHHH